MNRRLGLVGTVALGLVLALAGPAAAASKTLYVPDDFNPRCRTPGRPGTTRWWAPACTSGPRATPPPTRSRSTSTLTSRWPTWASRPWTTQTRRAAGPPASSSSSTSAHKDADSTPTASWSASRCYGDDWWLNNAAKQFVKDGAPITHGRLGQRQPRHARPVAGRVPGRRRRGLRLLARLRREGRRRHQRDQLRRRPLHLRRARRAGPARTSARTAAGRPAPSRSSRTRATASAPSPGSNPVQCEAPARCVFVPRGRLCRLSFAAYACVSSSAVGRRAASRADARDRPSVAALTHPATRTCQWLSFEPLPAPVSEAVPAAVDSPVSRVTGGGVAGLTSSPP